MSQKLGELFLHASGLILCDTLMHVQDSGEAAAARDDAQVERARLQALLEGAGPTLRCLAPHWRQLQASVHAGHWLMPVVQIYANV